MSQRPILLQYFRRNGPMGPPTCFDGGECIKSLSLARSVSLSLSLARSLALFLSLSPSLSLSLSHTRMYVSVFFCVVVFLCCKRFRVCVSWTCYNRVLSFTRVHWTSVSEWMCGVCVWVCVYFSLSMNVHYFRCCVCYARVLASVFDSVPECFYVFVCMCVRTRILKLLKWLE